MVKRGPRQALLSEFEWSMEGARLGLSVHNVI